LIKRERDKVDKKNLSLEEQNVREGKKKEKQTERGQIHRQLGKKTEREKKEMHKGRDIDKES
jgi:hypothetical protein